MIGHTNGRRLVTRRLPFVAAAAAIAVGMAGCGGSSSPVATTATTTTAAAGPVLLTTPTRTVTFAEAKRAIDRLYAAHPGIASFEARNVQYNEITRDKVLDVCRRGGRETDPASIESIRVAGCAPLIFYFYSYGSRQSVPESIAVARKLYWYAATNIDGPFDAEQSLAAVLRSWGLR